MHCYSASHLDCTNDLLLVWFWHAVLLPVFIVMYRDEWGSEAGKSSLSCNLAWPSLPSPMASHLMPTSYILCGRRQGLFSDIGKKNSLSVTFGWTRLWLCMISLYVFLVPQPCELCERKCMRFYVWVILSAVSSNRCKLFLSYWWIS